MTSPPDLHVGVALEGAGWHPAAWRDPEARPTELLTADYWVELARRAERGRLDLLTIEDSLTLEPNRQRHQSGPDRVDRVRGHLDAVLIAARIAPRTSRIGLIPTITATHTEPFHVSKAIATLDYVSHGRAGVRVQVSARAHEAAHFGRRDVDPTRTMDEATDYVEVVRRLWDSWEDDAEIRDAATGRFVDRDRLHYIDFQGDFFSVKGPSITPRPPQGQPIVAALAHREPATTFAATQADIVFVTPTDVDDAVRQVDAVRAAWAAAGRDQRLHVWGDLLVHLGESDGEAESRKARLDEWAGGEPTSDAACYVGDSRALDDVLRGWREAGLTGVRLRPATLPHDLDLIVDQVTPYLDGFRQEYREPTLRERLGLSRPADRYATT